jgi:hypothetical protein
MKQWEDKEKVEENGRGKRGRKDEYQKMNRG